VRQVVDDCADARASEVAGEREIRGEQKGEERPGRVVGVEVERHGGDDHGEALDSKKPCRETRGHVARF
jgi:hypothetical protein